MLYTYTISLDDAQALRVLELSNLLECDEDRALRDVLNLMIRGQFDDYLALYEAAAREIDEEGAG